MIKAIALSAFLLLMIACLQENCICPKPSPESLESAKAENPSGFDFSLMGIITAIQRLQGEVFDEKGKAVSNAAVRVYRYKEERDENDPLSKNLTRGDLIATCKTAPDGRFCFPDLEAGMYEIVVTAGKAYYTGRKSVGLIPQDRSLAGRKVRITIRSAQPEASTATR
jgi:hypothetical protein